MYERVVGRTQLVQECLKLYWGGGPAEVSCTLKVLCFRAVTNTVHMKYALTYSTHEVRRSDPRLSGLEL